MSVNVRAVGRALGLPESATNAQIEATALVLGDKIGERLPPPPSHESYLVHSFPGVAAKLGITARTLAGEQVSPLPNREAGARNNVETGEQKHLRRMKQAEERDNRDAAVYAWLTGSRAPAQTLRY